MKGSNRKLYDSTIMNNVRHGLSGMFIFISDVNQSSSGNEFLWGTSGSSHAVQKLDLTSDRKP